MLIVSQNKEVLINFSNIKVMTLEECHKTPSFTTYSIGVFGIENTRSGFLLGEYMDKERAKALLKDIALDAEAGYVSLYEMPEE